MEILQDVSPFSYTDGEFAYLEEDMDMGTFIMERQAATGEPFDWEREIERREVNNFPHLPNIRPIDLTNLTSGNETDGWQKRFADSADECNKPFVSLRKAYAFNEVVPVNFADDENAPVEYDSLTIICPRPFENGEPTDACRNFLINTARRYSKERKADFMPFVSSGGSTCIYSNNVAEDDALPDYIHPKRKIGTYAPLMLLDAPLEMEKPFEKLPNGNLLFTDGWGVRFKDIPGTVVNDGYPGSDGAVYSIDYDRDLKEWSLYRCRKIKKENNFVIEIKKVGRSLTIQELNADHKSVSLLYNELDRVNICLEGSEVIALGLPIHNGNF